MSAGWPPGQSVIFTQAKDAESQAPLASEPTGTILLSKTTQTPPGQIAVSAKGKLGWPLVALSIYVHS